MNFSLFINARRNLAEQLALCAIGGRRFGSAGVNNREGMLLVQGYAYFLRLCTGREWHRSGLDFYEGISLSQIAS